MRKKITALLMCIGCTTTFFASNQIDLKEDSTESKEHLNNSDNCKTTFLVKDKSGQIIKMEDSSNQKNAKDCLSSARTDMKQLEAEGYEVLRYNNNFNM